MGPWRLPTLRWPTVRWPTLLLLASIGLVTLGLLEANRAVRSHRVVAEHALQDYAGFAAWSYQQHLRETLNGATLELLGAVNHGDQLHPSAEIPDVHELAHYIQFDPLCGCHRPRRGPSPSIFFGFRLGSDTVGVSVNMHDDPIEGWEVDRKLVYPASADRRTGYAPDERAWIHDTLTRQIRDAADDGRFPLVIGTHGGTVRLLVYTLMPTIAGDTIVYGAEYARGAFAGLLADVMADRGLLPATFTRGHPVRDVVRVRVTSPQGEALFESEPVRDWALDDTVRLAPAYGSLLVRAQIRPALAGDLVIGGLPASRVPFLVGLMAVAAALSLVAVGQLRREGELARMRGDFVDSISHELRTPLAQMRLYLETLRLGRFTTEAQRARSLDNVERETTRLSQLVERVLRFSRVGRDDEGARAPVDVADEVTRLVGEFAPLAGARRARLQVDASPVPTLWLRPAALRHVLLNLLDNAVKYGPAEQTVRVRVHRVGDAVHIAVADEGPGVPAAERAAVWRPYQRGRQVGHTAGSGIGLAIVRDVAAQHGGRAWIEDGVGGRGATVVVALPVTPAADAAPRAAMDDASTPTLVHG